MANAFEKAIGKADPPKVTEQSPKRILRKKPTPLSKSAAAIQWMLDTGATQYAAARKFNISPAAISYQRRINREAEYCPHCGHKYPDPKRAQKGAKKSPGKSQG